MRMDLDDASALARVDAHAVREVLGDFPAQCRQGRAVAVPPPRVKSPRMLVVAAMGGSAASGDLLAAWAAEQVDVPVLVHRGYGLPATATAGTLIVASSYSGDTEEVVSAVTEALRRRLEVVVVTTGGRLAGLAGERGLPRVVLPGGLMPRMALGHLFFPLLGVAAAAGLPAPGAAEVEEALATLDDLAARLGPATPTPDNEAKQIALLLDEALPAIYGGPSSQTAAYRWKTDLAENAKLFALAGALPEVTHNEIEAWGHAGQRSVAALLLRDAGEGPALARRFEALRALIAPAAAAVREVRAPGHGRLARLLGLVYLGQWVSFYAAMRRGVDPWPIPLIDALKRRLAP